MTVAEARPSSAVKQWIACRGWFAGGRGHVGPAWIGMGANGRIIEIATSPPREGPIAFPVEPCYAVPLLADTHVHVYMDPWPVDPKRRVPPGGKPFEVEVEDAVARVDAALRQGVGLLRDMGDPHGINLAVKRRLADRGTPAPELLVCGTGFHRPKKYGRFLGVARESVSDVRRAIDEMNERGGIDFIKVVTTGIVDFAHRRMNQPPQFSAAELTEVVRHAHDLDLKVASHCSGEEGIEINLAAGVDFIEHAYFVREDQIDRMIERGVAWTPTLAPVDAQGRHEECLWPTDVRRNIDAILDEHQARITYAAERGAKILVGTDAGAPGVDMGGGIRIELTRLARAGIPAERLLHASTAGNAAAIGADSYSPSLEVGAAASFALYADCPWRDVEHLTSLRHVFVAGEQIC